MNEETRVIQPLTREEQDLLYFTKPFGYHTRLQQYWEYPQGFAQRTTPAESTVALSNTKVFRRCLRQFIRNFRSEPLTANTRLCLEGNGRFCVRTAATDEEITDLTESEFCLFQYLCFLQIRRFWNDLRRRCRFPAVLLPVLIGDLSARWDNRNALLQRALQVSSQVLIV